MHSWHAVDRFRVVVLILLLAVTAVVSVRATAGDQGPAGGQGVGACCSRGEVRPQ